MFSKNIGVPTMLGSTGSLEDGVSYVIRFVPDGIVATAFNPLKFSLRKCGNIPMRLARRAQAILVTPNDGYPAS